MATESIFQVVKLNNESADRMIAAMDEADMNPSQRHASKIKWGDAKKFSDNLKRKYANAK